MSQLLSANETVSPPDTPPSSADAAAAHAGRWTALVVLAMAQLMVVLDATVVNIALPTAQRALGFSNDDRQWVVTGYALVFGSLLLLGGRLSDFFGRKRMFIIGVIGFALASALGGAAQNFQMLLAARALQGAFGAALAPAALALLSTTFTDRSERSKAFGIYGAISAAGGAVGLLLGGLLTEYASWRWCLYVNLVIAAIALAGAVFKLHDSPPMARQRLDLPGAVTAVVGLVGVVYGLANAETHGWSAPSTIIPILVGLIVLALFVLIEKRSSHALLPLRVILDRNRGGAYLTIAVAGIGMFGVFLFLTYYLSGILGFTPVQTGLAFLPMMAVLVPAATLSGSLLVPRVGPRPIIPAGALLAAVGMLTLTHLGQDSSYVSNILPGLLLIGFGLGLVFAPVQNAATSGVEAADSGVASAMINTVQQVGGSIGTALLSSFAASAASGYLAGRTPTAAASVLATLHSYHVVFWWSAGFFVACAVFAGVLFRSGPLETDPAADAVMVH
jgi:EmrB/QacA subfamily drug resistance transporter